MTVIQYLLYPLPLALILVLLGALLWARGWRVGGVLLFAALAGLWALATEPVSQALRAQLENRYPAVAADEAPAADAIVVLGGGVAPALAPRVSPELRHAGDRLRMGFDLWAAGRAARIITTGGPHRAAPDGQTQAAAMAELLMRWGVPEADIIVRGDSATTYEDALTVRRVVEREGFDQVLLVTSALHMRRAQAVFDSQGVHVLPVPANFEGLHERPRHWSDWLPGAEALWISSRVWHEHAGLLYYRMRGRVE